MMCLSVDVEGWSHYLLRSGKETTPSYQSSRFFDLSISQSLRSLLKVLGKYGATSTFFVLGEIARSSPEIVEEIHNLGHEIASHGYSHVQLTKTDINDFEKKEKMNMALLEKITGERPKGFRAPTFNINAEVINSLERIGYVYDSSVVPSIMVPGWFGLVNAPLHPYHPGRLDISKTCEQRNICEVPLAVFPLLRLPVVGGWFLRNIGVTYTKTAIKLLLRKRIPVILMIHLQDLSVIRPKVEGAPFHMFRNSGRYALKAVEIILHNFKTRTMPISEIISTWDMHAINGL
ncbi:MAG: polysaccharide deacetylase family protein [Candidatus Bathyarchaeota archaeon]|nr:MAG: polysaccharide deacetylase family protein [Candidatus Bathyarchaeota archaeon]